MKINFKNLKIVKRIKNLLKRLATPGESLSEKTVKGGFWIFTLRISDRIFQLIRTIILARLLSPNDFGVFGIALLVLSTLDTFSQAGFQQALIQKKGETRSYLDTAWTVGFIRGFIIASVVFFLAKPAAIFFEAPAAENILRIIGISIILQSLNNIAVLYFQKELQFHKFFKYQFLGTIADVTVAITSAFLLKSVWALVFGLLAGNLVRCIMSYVIEPYRPRFRFNRTQAKELFGFGRWILGSSILVFLITQGDDIFVGKLLGAIMLGFYQMAYRISNLPATEITHVILSVTFPAYSKIQDNILRLRKAYLKTLKIVSLSTIPLTCGIIALAPEFVIYILGDKWASIIPAIQILAVFGFIRALGGINGSVLQAVGRPDILTKLNIIKLLIIVITIYPLSIWKGMIGVCISVLLSALSITPTCFYISMTKILKGNIRMLLEQTFIPAIGGISMMFLLIIINLNNLGILGLIIEIIIGILIYCVFIFVLDKIFKKGNLEILKELLYSIRESK